MSQNNAQPRTGIKEFVALLALSMSLVAMSIDMVLPGLDDIGHDFDIVRNNTRQFVFTALFIGLSIGQFIAGPLSDSIGRKKTIYVGLSIFMAGSILAYAAGSFNMLLAGRFIQGLGAAAPRIISVAMVRDRYKGREMARVMSYIMGIFILVPTIAPTLGQGIIMAFDWRVIFLFLMAVTVVIYIWMVLRLVELLDPLNRRPLTIPFLRNGLKTIFGELSTVCYMVAAGFTFGGLLGYLNSAQQVFQQYYNVGDEFVIYFGIIAISTGVSFAVNARLVPKLGMRYIVMRAMIGIIFLAILMIGVELVFVDNVPFIIFMIYIMATSFCIGMVFGNLNALAMEPLGHMAGMASSVIGSISLIIASLCGALIGQLYNGTLLPLTIGYGLLGAGAFCTMLLAEKR